MRKAILLTAAAAFLAVPAVVQAQSETITASASVPGFISIANDGNVSFGNLAFEEDQVADNYGRFKIDHNQGYTVVFTGDQALALDGVEETITVTWTCLVNGEPGETDGLDGPDNECAFGENGYERTLSHTSGRQTTFFHVGGIIDGSVLTNHPVGQYTGSLTLTVKDENT